jgi:hypothetical protein
MIKLIYCSHSRIGHSARAYAGIHDILATARAANARLGITGALLLSAEYFAHILEGPAEAVEPMFTKIRNDPRHDDICLLYKRPMTERRFARWSMAFEHHNALDPEEPCIFRHAFATRSERAGQRIENLISHSLGRAKAA